MFQGSAVCCCYELQSEGDGFENSSLQLLPVWQGTRQAVLGLVSSSDALRLLMPGVNARANLGAPVGLLLAVAAVKEEKSL